MSAVHVVSRMSYAAPMLLARLQEPHSVQSESDVDLEKRTDLDFQLYDIDDRSNSDTGNESDEEQTRSTPVLREGG